MHKSILVLTNSQDGTHTATVVDKLEAMGAIVFRFDSDELAKGKTKLEVKAGRKGEFACAITNSDGKSLILNPASVRSVWYRRPNFFNSPIRDQTQRDYAEGEMKTLLDGIWLSLPEVFWLNNPLALERARKKVYQWRLAAEMGIPVPRTLISNDPETVRDFFDECGGKVVFKSLYNEFVSDGEKHYNIPTSLVTRESLAKADLVRRMPALFQEFINKKHELRITVVGKKVFAAMIQCHDADEGIVDWRHPFIADKVCYTAVEAPEEIRNACFRLMRVLGLSFAAFDFVVDENQWYFLEVNPNGQWYWIEEATKLMISDAICSILMAEP